MSNVKLLLISMLLMLSLFSFSQVTTSSVSGKVTGNNETLIGATVIAVHEPSGTNYGTVTNQDGNFTIQGMRTGGPYRIEISYIGYQKLQYTKISLTLGEQYRIDANLKEDASVLGEVVIVAESMFDRKKTGAATNVDSYQLQNLPTINRSINDFTRLTPQANGNSFAGRDGRYNYITIDGAAFNNSFGLSGQTRNLPGGDAQPISLDAIDQISVNISPFDIRQSNFTGASVNAVTKSGDNTYKGSGYTYLRPESFAGTKIEGKDYELDKTSKQTYGFSIGGPIIKNKLFFFVNAEYENSEYPSTSWKVSQDGKADPANYISRAKESDLSTLKNYLQSNYGYDAGTWDWGPFTSENYKILGRIDWNINKVHKLTVRYNQVVSTNDVLTNATSSPAGSFTNGRIGSTGMAFTNSGYGFENTVRSLTGELNSTFGGKFSNKLLTTYTMVRDKRTSNSSMFPFVDILEGGEFYTTFGYELYTYNNDVKNNTFSIIDNFSAYFGNHALTAGLSYEQMYFGNAYMRFGTGYYRYNSLNDFLTDKAPALYSITYGLNGNSSPFSELDFGMGAFYLQDEWQLNSRFKLTGGIRFELPFYLNDLQPNNAISELSFVNGQKIDVGTWPKQQLLVSPRISFNWDVMGDSKLKIRGGTGIFTGRLPFVWFVNQPTNAGTLQYTKTLNGIAQIPTDMRFDKDINTQILKYPTIFEPTTPSDLAEVSKNFKMPQVWRTNLAADFALPQDMTFTLEGIYTKDINTILQQNINEAAPDKNFSGSDTRPYYSSTSKNRINSATTSAMVLDNTDKGYQYSITAQLTKKFTRGLSGSVAYTFSEAKDLTSNPGDQAASAWRSNVAVGSLNDPGLSYSNFSVPHRVVASASYAFDWLNVFTTTVSLFYQGSAQGRLNYMYANDINLDGQASDLMYIPKDKNDIIFVDLTAYGSDMTPEKQSDAFFKFMQQDDYMTNHKGEYAQRFGALLPWRHQFDFKFAQDFYYDKKSGRKIQLTFDIMNLGNLLNSSWGILKSQITGSYDNLPLLYYAGANSEGKPTFALFNPNPSKNSPPPTYNPANYYTETYKTVLGYGSTWSMQAGLRVTF